MTEEKLNAVVEALTGLKTYERMKTQKAVQNIFDQKYARLEIDDQKKMLTNLKLEIGELDTEL